MPSLESALAELHAAADTGVCMQLNVQYTLVPDAGSYPYLPLTGLPYPSEAPPNITNSICSAQFLDNMSVRDRYIMNVKFLIGQVIFLRCILTMLLPFRVATEHSQSPACQMVLRSIFVQLAQDAQSLIHLVGEPFRL